jgi:hypothetical protein
VEKLILPTEDILWARMALGLPPVPEQPDPKIVSLEALRRLATVPKELLIKFNLDPLNYN